MKVAFDVKGTLWGPDKVLALYKWFESKGCEMIVWSSVYSYAVEAANELGLAGEVMSKRERLDKREKALNPDYTVDIAVDDDNFVERGNRYETWLACEFLIAVHDIPNDESEFEAMYGHFFKEILDA